MGKRLAVLIFTAVAAQAQKPITVTFGEPIIRSLDQAHYLLEQRFQKNYALEATRPTADDLNANAVNGNKLTAIRSLLSAGATLDQSVGANNSFAQQRIAEDLAARPDRNQQLRASFDKQADFSAQINAIAQDKSNYFTKADGTTDLNADAKAKTVALNVALDTEKRRGELIKSQLSDSVPMTLKPTDSTSIPSLGFAADTLKDEFSFKDAKLAASNAVDNFVNLQNEMIMKQVTLLRNEAGYNRRIVFAELPQSFEVEGLRWYRHASENKLVQVRWRLKGFLYVSRTNHTGFTDEPSDPLLRTEVIARTRYLMNRSEQAVSQEAVTNAVLKNSCYGKEPDKPIVRADKADKTSSTSLSSPRSTPIVEPVNCVGGVAVSMPAGTLRTLELVPRQSSLNVNDRHYANTTVNLFGLFRLLSGVGVNVNYQRQKEAYEQYINQEVYATSYGKGSSEFGWIFGANPGTQTVAAGQRTTYAVFSVPANAVSVVLEAQACVFDRRDRLNEAKDCRETGETETAHEFVVQIPSEYNSGFWIDEARYAPVVADTRQVVYLSGRYISDLTGVTVNGVSLRRSVSIAAPELTPPTGVPNGDGGIIGEYQLIGSNQLIMAFRMPAGFTGTPNIALITPVKARYLNDLKLRTIIVGSHKYVNHALNHPDVFPMFYARPEIKSARAVDDTIELEGTGLSQLDSSAPIPWVTWFWNDTVAPIRRPTGVVSRDAYADRILLAVPGADKSKKKRADVRIEYDPDFGIAPARLVMPDPASLSVSGASILKFIKPDEGSKQRAAALLEISGANLDAVTDVQLTYSDGVKETVIPRVSGDGKLIALIAAPPAGGFAVFTASETGTTARAASGSVQIPAPPAPTKDQFMETERTIKQVPIQKTSN